MALPGSDDGGDLPPGVHAASLSEVRDRLGSGTAHRAALALRLERIHRVAEATGHLARFVVFGSFVTAKAEPGDIDVFLLMDDGFDASRLGGEERLLFDHSAAQAHFGASIFWLRRQAALEGEQAAVEYWQVTRAGGRRGIVEICPEAR